MQSFWSENMSDDDVKWAIGELIRGRDFTNQLKDMLKRNQHDTSSSSKVDAEDLVVQILGTFSNTLWILNSIQSDEVSDGGAPVSPECDGRRSEGSSGSCKTLVKDRRGCYKRRKTSEAQTIDSSTLVDDGHAWRKYGQKVILNAKFPRNYFRCTHKFDQNCQATKQVQMLQSDPPLYRTTYLSQHTCRNSQKYPHIILHPTQPDSSSVLLCFGQNSPNHNYPTFNTPSIKLENNPDTLYHPRSHIGSSCSDHFGPSDRDHLPSSPFDTSCHVAAISSASDYGDGISSGCTVDNNVNEMIGADDFDEFLRSPLNF